MSRKGGSLGNFPLNNAANNMNYQAIEILLDAGARVNVVNYFGESPLHNAAKRSCVRSVAPVVEGGGRCECKKQKWVYSFALCIWIWK